MEKQLFPHWRYSEHIPILLICLSYIVFLVGMWMIDIVGIEVPPSCPQKCLCYHVWEYVVFNSGAHFRAIGVDFKLPSINFILSHLHLVGILTLKTLVNVGIGVCVVRSFVVSIWTTNNYEREFGCNLRFAYSLNNRWMDVYLWIYFKYIGDIHLIWQFLDITE